MNSDDETTMMDVDPIPFSAKGKAKANGNQYTDDETLPWCVSLWLGRVNYSRSLGWKNIAQSLLTTLYLTKILLQLVCISVVLFKL